jgi:hypothetical protein
MAINISLENHEAVFLVSAIETEIAKHVKFCSDTDKQFGSMNNIHKRIMRDLLDARETLLVALINEGYAMRRIASYDLNSPEWQDIKETVT